MSRHRTIIILLLALVVLFSVPVIAESPPCPLAFALEARPVMGIDRIFRGGSLGANAWLDLGRVIGPAFSGLETGLDCSCGWDLGLGCATASCDFSLGFFGDLAILVGYELPLGQASCGPDSAQLEPGSGPNHFGLRARLFGPGYQAKEVTNPCLEVLAEMTWTAWRLSDSESLAGQAAVSSGISSFAVGFRASIVLRLSWRASGES